MGTAVDFLWGDEGGCGKNFVGGVCSQHIVFGEGREYAGREGGKKEWLFKRLMMQNTMYLTRHSMQVALQLPCLEGANIFHQFDGWHQAD